MAPTFAPAYVTPGFYVKQFDISTPNVPQGARIAAIIGQGAKTRQRLETIVRGAVAAGTDGPLTGSKAISVISVVDQNNVVYTQDVDFQALRSGSNLLIDWSLKFSITGDEDMTAGGAETVGATLEGKHLKVTVDGVAYDIVFSGCTTGVSIRNFINSWDPALASCASLSTANYLVLSGKSLDIIGGDGLTLLGLTQGDNGFVLEPAAGVTYQVTYTSDATASEYEPVLYSNMNDIIAVYGDKWGQEVLYTGTATAAGAATLTDAAQTWTTDELVGKYVKITGGDGKGQVRVILSNTATVITVSQNWSSGDLPTVSSTFSVTDINDNSISKGAQVAFDTGATLVICSQYADDLFNDSNIRLAIDNLKESVQGQDPDCLVLMKGLGVAETAPLTYLKNHVTEMSNELNNKWRVAIVGLASGNETFTDFKNIAEGTKNRRIALVNISTVSRDFGDGNVQSLDGSYVAAAVAGVYCAFVDSGEPITRKSVANAFDVDLFVDPFLVVEKNSMAGSGVCIIERQGTDLRIRHALTTDNTSIFTQELKLTRSADFISKYLKTNLENTLTGKRFVVSRDGSADLVQTAKASVSFLLEALTNPQAQIITSYENLSVTQNSTEKRQLDIKADIFLTSDCLWSYALLGFSV